MRRRDDFLYTCFIGQGEVPQHENGLGRFHSPCRLHYIKNPAGGNDASAGLAFSSNGAGTLTVVQESSPGKFEVAEIVTTQKGARIMTIDPTTHLIYLPTAKFEKRSSFSKHANQAGSSFQQKGIF
jgi:hypothetical protein